MIVAVAYWAVLAACLIVVIGMATVSLWALRTGPGSKRFRARNATTLRQWEQQQR